MAAESTVDGHFLVINARKVGGGLLDKLRLLLLLGFLRRLERSNFVVAAYSEALDTLVGIDASLV